MSNHVSWERGETACPNRDCRHAVVTNAAPEYIRTIRAYLPRHYSARVAQLSDGPRIVITGTDHAGWTLDGYVIPRLASGFWFAREVTPQNDHHAGHRPWALEADPTSDHNDPFPENFDARGDAFDGGRDS